MSSHWCPSRKREAEKRLTVWRGLGGCEVSSWKVRARGGRWGLTVGWRGVEGSKQAAAVLGEETAGLITRKEGSERQG